MKNRVITRDVNYCTTLKNARFSDTDVNIEKKQYHLVVVKIYAV